VPWKFTSFLAKTFSNFFKDPASRMYARVLRLTKDRTGNFRISDNDTKSPWPMTAIAAAEADLRAKSQEQGDGSWEDGKMGRTQAQAQAETGKCFFTIKMMDDIINNVGVRPNRGFPVVVYFDINEILLFSPFLLLILDSKPNK